MCSYIATERQKTQETSMKTSDNGGFLRLLLLLSTPSRRSSYSRHGQLSRRRFFRITFVYSLAAVSIRRYSMSFRLRVQTQPHAQ